MVKKSSWKNNTLVQFLIVATVVSALVATVSLAKQRQSLNSDAYYSWNSTALRAYPSNVMPSNSLRVAYYTLQPTTTDWIGLFKKDAVDTTYVSKKLLSECTTYTKPTEYPHPSTTVTPKPSVTVPQWQTRSAGFCGFTAPSALGTYEFRMFRNNVKISTSNTVSVTNNPEDEDNDDDREWPTGSISPKPTRNPSLSPTRNPSVTGWPTRYPSPTNWPKPSVSISPKVSCIPAPPCVTSGQCEIETPEGGWCPFP